MNILTQIISLSREGCDISFNSSFVSGGLDVTIVNSDLDKKAWFKFRYQNIPEEDRERELISEIDVAVRKLTGYKKK